MRIIPTQNVGIELATTENDVMLLSAIEFCLTAEITPNGMANSRDNTSEENASSSVRGILPKTSSETGLPVI